MSPDEGPQPIPRGSDRTRWILLAILALALLLRAIHFLQIAPAPFTHFPVVDARMFQQMAEAFASGDLVGDTAYQKGPLYPHLIAHAIKFRGQQPPREDQVIRPTRHPHPAYAVPGVIDGVRPVDGGIGFTIDSGGRVFEHEAECFLMAAGRHAAVADLGLEHMGISLENGSIVHNDAMQTTNPEVFVAGDATNEWQILHIANEEGEVAGLNAAAGEIVKRVDRRLVMGVIYTDPPFTQVGVSETEARKRGYDAVCATVRFPETGRAITMGTQYGVWSMVADRETREILGSAILGPRADDLVHAVSVLMYNRNKVDEIFDMPWYHPTLSEVILNLARDLTDQMSRQ